MESQIGVSIEIAMLIIKCLNCESKVHEWQEYSLNIGFFFFVVFIPELSFYL